MLNLGQQAFKRGDYKWAATLLNNLVFAEPERRTALLLQADVLEQLGYQAESGPWRNFYLSGATELRNGIQKVAAPNTACIDVILNMSMAPNF
ncbi:alkyl sulfatase dimerization domain-containing protein [uncultured Shewanella sp.]|uniref:alkyl sulfatase dimerization domain-containing protein n=1 Tax=uncultured Shewanella sp. TaxID=173975 RepID=UPI00262450D1|nr:alkyl sulfatase dimerization domain-containing protein [uncultured Shewanella sp.]